MRTNALDQGLIEGPPLEACHGKRVVAVAVLMTGFECGEGHRTQTGIAVKIQFGFCTRLAIAQPSKLFGVAKQKFDLKTRLGITVEPQGMQVNIRAKEHGISVAFGMDDDRHLEIAFQLLMIDHLMIQHNVLVFSLK